MERKIKKVKVAGNREIEFETGKIARQANGAVLVKMGETVLFTSACVAKEASAEVDFLPLRVDYQEKFSAAGKSLGGFIKREGRPSEREILVSRLIDRPLRPFFADGFYKETQILSYVWSYDGVNSPDALAITAASAALVISDIPLIKPVAGVRVGRIDGHFVINPTNEEMERSDLDLMLAGSEDAILMIEGYCDFLSEEQVLKAIETGHEAIKKICHALLEWQKEIGKEKNMEGLHVLPSELVKEIEKLVGDDLAKAVQMKGKAEREEATSACATKVSEHFAESEFTAVDVKMAFKKVNANLMRRMILDKGIRADGRRVDEVRKIDVEAGFLPRTHGSALFTRGETQSVAVCTLGGESMGQRFETLDEDSVRRFYLQYFFPPFSVGEVGRVGSPGRREVGHGKLAERALFAAAPSLEDFPYTIRLESNITESNGSSSMASVCGGCIAMMDAGVPIKSPVAGIAMGLILEGKEVAILSDILGLEDALGDMDFKVTGDSEGITAFQMDIKVEGITLDIMRDALNQAKAGRIHILEKMLEALPEARKEMSIYAPRIETVKVPQNKIATIIGPGGKQIRAIIEETGAQIDINDDGLVSIASSNPQSMQRAKQIIEGLTAEVQVGKVYDGKVTSVVQFGVFVEILPGKEGLCHISELSKERVADIFAYIKEGTKIQVKVLDINERGQLKLSRKVLMDKTDEAKV